MQKRGNALVKRKAAKPKEGPTAVRENTLVKWMKEFPIMNEVTHFACLMDPKYGTIKWIERGSYVEDSEDEEMGEVRWEAGAISIRSWLRRWGGRGMTHLEMRSKVNIQRKTKGEGRQKKGRMV